MSKVIEKTKAWFCWRCKLTVPEMGKASAMYCPKGHLMKEVEVTE